MPEVIISASGPQFGLIINAEGRALVDLGGDIIISGVNIDSVVIKETDPTADTKNNPAWQFDYMTSGTATGITTGSSIGSIIQFIDAGSFVQTITYANNNITNIGSWS